MQTPIKWYYVPIFNMHPSARGISLFLLLLVAFACTTSLSYAGTDARKLKVAVFPFNDTTRETADMRVSSLLNAELAARPFIETVSPEITRMEIYEAEPAYLWGEKENKKSTVTKEGATESKESIQKKGGILWKVEPKIVERVSKRVKADFTVHGDISWFNKKWVVNASLTNVGEKTVQSFTQTGDAEEDMPAKLGEMATEIAIFIRDETIVEEAEEEVRKFLGYTYSLPVAVKKLEDMAKFHRESIPLKTLLLDLYLRDEANYSKKIMDLSTKIISLYDPANDADTRYLRSRDLDPFDVLASAHEKRKEWAKAIDVREKALKLFSFKEDKHKKSIGLDTYHLADTLERKGQKGKALQYYRKALPLLPKESKERQRAEERVSAAGE